MVTLSPHTLDEAVAALSAGQVTILAGGTDLFAALGERPMRTALLDLTRCAEVACVERTPDGGWRIGAGVTWSALDRAALPLAFDGLKTAARQVGSVQIQNTATLVGNVCNASPAADGVPALLALDASVEIASARGRRIVPLADFVVGPRRTVLAPGEMASAILVPPQPAGAVGVFEKLGARRYLVISITMVAAVVATDEAGIVTAARVAVGACGPVALRLAALEAVLVGRLLAMAADAVEPAHLAPLTPIDDVRAPAAYRHEATLTLVRRALGKASGRPGVAA